MGRKCGISECLSDSGRPEDIGVTFHKIPLHPDIRPKWMSLCKIPEDKQNLKVVYICSRHFLRADFCNFKGKKYMLKQGVLPSVFPWNKSKLDKNPNKMEVEIKKEFDTVEDVHIKTEIDETSEIKAEIKSEPMDSLVVKEEIMTPNQSTTIEQKTKTVDTSTGPLVFAPNTQIEALDFNQCWGPAKVVEVDYEENEVLIHFEKYSNKYDEWISMNSSTLRALAPPSKKTSNINEYVVGERCMASWTDARKFPATITKMIDADTYEVQFDDGYVKLVKSSKLAKGKLQASPLFEPVTSSKQERRDRKRKINIAALFGKKTRAVVHEEKASSETSMLSPNEEPENWTPTWENGRPIGEDSVIDAVDGPRKSVLVPDPKLPTKWQKHLVQRTHGASAGKWDALIVSPEGRRFRTRTEIKAFIDDNPELNLAESMFDFSLYRRTKNRRSIPVSDHSPAPESSSVSEIKTEEEPSESQNSLKIPIVDNAYKCPIEGCGKNFRRENLAQMHVKHYHPEYTKFLDSTPNVADLAYARTVGESLDRSPGPDKSRASTSKPVPKTSTPKPAPKPPQSPTIPEPEPIEILQKPKDSEIIKLLNSKPFDSIKKEDSSQVQAIPSGLPASMYPDIKLKDLLTKSEGIPKRDDLNLKTLSTVRPTGIKTLLPVIRNVEHKSDDDLQRMINRRKRVHPENLDIPKREPEPLVIKQEIKPEPNNVIIEGGEVIKIVRMKREEIINCTCGLTEEDGLMIQCELCLCWQHAYCNNIERENQVPDKYICYICQNPTRQRSSKKYFHDQDWLKNGTLPTGSYHCKDEENLNKRFEKLKKSHNLSGSLIELKGFLHKLNMKIKIAGAKNHPKLYLWSKPWEKQPLPEEQEMKETEEIKSESESMLMSLLKTNKEEYKLKDDLEEFPKVDLNALIDNHLDSLPSVPIVPQPEAAIDSADCRVNLLEHIAHCQSLVEQRLNAFEKQIDSLETESTADEKDENYPRVRQSIEMMLRDLNVLKEFSVYSTI